MSRKAASGFRRQASASALLLVLLAVFVAACGGDDGGPESVAGVWELVSIEGQPLPIRLYADETDTMIYNAATLTLDAAHTYELLVEADYFSSLDGWKEVSVVGDGQWERDGDDVRLWFETPTESIEQTLYYENGRLVTRGQFSGDLAFEE
jgi:hypothetical protein